MSHVPAARGPESGLRHLRDRDIISRHGSRSLTTAIWDIFQGLLYVPLWSLMALQDIKQRYRRSALGPFWLTISMGIMVGTLGTLYGTLFNLPVEQYMPHVTLGFLAWGLISGVINDGSTVFVEAHNYIKQIKLPLSTFVYRIVCRNVIILAHNFLIYIIVIIAFGIWPGAHGLLVIPGLLVVLATSLWVALLMGTICARFRDIPPIATSILQVAFFLTPIIWMPSQAGSRMVFVDVNPFFHFVELIRAPLLGNAPTALSWAVTLSIMILGWIGTLLFFRQFRGRVAYWVA